jgi:BMFP domain-containing protein YqiC
MTAPVISAGDLVERLKRIATMAQVAIDTGGREDFDPRGVEDDVLEAIARIDKLEAEHISDLVVARGEVSSLQARIQTLEAAIQRALDSLCGDYPSMAADLRSSLNQDGGKP